MFKHALTALVVTTLLGVAPVIAQERPPVPRPAGPGLRSEVRELQAAMPLSFEANRGQTDPRVKFVARAPGYDLFLTAGAAVLSPEDGGVPLTITLVGASKSPDVSGLGPLQGKVNYFIGSDPAQWRAGVPRFRQVRAAGVYPGIDLIYYGKQRELEYDFYVAPGSDPRRIRLRFSGADGLAIDAAGDLVLRTSRGEVRQRKPLMYQDIDGVRRTVSGRYTMRGASEVGFEVGSYDASKRLVIDPVLLYSSFLGGAGDDVATDVAVDAAGMIYVTGWTSSVNFPTRNTIIPPPAPDFFQPAFGSRRQDVFVTKIDPAQSAESSLVYSTYLGGFDSEEARAIAVDAAGNAYIAGWTTSMRHPGHPPEAAFPVTGGAFQSTLKLPRFGVPSDGFIAKLSPLGGALLYSTYFGGGSVDIIEDIAVDAGGRVFVTGQTESLRADDSGQSPLPTTPGAYQTADSALIVNGAAAFAASFDPAETGAASLLYSTYLGGTGGDYGRGIAVNANGEALIAGTTTSFDFPVVDGFQTVNRGGNSGFVSRISADGTSLLYSTYVGGEMPCPFSGCSTGDLMAIAVDAAGNAYATGRATPGLPATPGAYQPTPVGSGFAPFVIKLDTHATGAASVVYVTYVSAGGFFDGAEAIAVDADGNVYVAGTTSGPFPTTADAVSQVHSGAGDAFAAKLNPAATALLYSTYLGGHDNDVARGIAVDPNGNIYIAGETRSSTFPVVNPAQPAHGGWVRDGFVAAIGRPVFTLSGEVLDRTTSDPVPGVTITLSGSRAATATTDANGFYSFVLPGESSYTVTPSRTGYTFLPASRTFPAFSENEFGDFTAVADGAPDPDPDPDPEDPIELPGGAFIKIGDIRVNAGRIVQLSGRRNSGTEVTEDGVYRLSQSVNVNALLFLEGEIEVTLDKAFKKLAVEIKSGHIYLANIPPFGKLTLWRGAGITFAIDGLSGKINDLVKIGLERMPLKVAGANFEIKSIKLVFGDDAGVDVAGTLAFPTFLNVPGLTASVDSLLISNKHGLRFGGQIKVEKIEVGGGFKINRVLLKYTPNYTNPARDVFVGEGDFTTPAFKVIGSVKFVGGALDSIGAAIKDLKFKPSITPATPVLTITGGELGIGGFREPPFFVLLSVDLSVGPEQLQKVLALKGAQIKYTYPSIIEGSTELTLLTVKIAKAFIGLDVAKPSIDLKTQVVLFDGTEIFIVTADLSAGRKTLESGEQVFYIAGGAKGIVQFPSQIMVNGAVYTGFPFDLLKGLGVTLPLQIVSAEVSYRDEEFKAAVSLPILDTVALSVKNIERLLPLELRDRLAQAIGASAGLDAEIKRRLGNVERLRTAVYDGTDLAANQALLDAEQAGLAVLSSQKTTVDREIADLRAASRTPQAKVATNFFLLPSEIILFGARSTAPGPVNVSYTSGTRTAAAQAIGTVTVPANAPKLITRLFSEHASPRYSLTAPDGTVLGPDSGGATFVSNAEAKVSYFVVNNPAAGRWTVTPDSDAQGPFTLDALGVNRPPVLDHVSAAATADGVVVNYSAADPDDAATVSLFYDTDNDGFNGLLIAEGLSESASGSYAWNPALDRVPSGDYYVYALVDDGANAPARRYSAGRVTIVDPRAPAAPGGVTAAGAGENSLRVTWAGVPEASGYTVRYSTTAADGHVVTSVADAGAQSEMVLPKLASNALYRVSVQAYKVMDVPDADSETGLRTDVATSVPSADVAATTGMAEAPVVRLTSPNGGETIAGNTTLTITWEVTRGGDLRDQQVELSTDGGAAYHPLALRLAPDVRSFEWDVPLVLQSARTRVRVSALDRAGNEGIDDSDADFIINGTPSAPETTIDILPPSIAATLSSPANAAGWHRGAVTVALDAADGGSGVKAITYSAAGSTVVPLTTTGDSSVSIPLSAEGATTITYVAVDRAGNVGAAQTIDVKIDATAPSATAHAATAAGPYTPGVWTKHDVTVAVSCADAASGVVTAGHVATVTAEGAGQSVERTCVDLAGNSASAGVAGINIDRTPPAITCATADGAWHAGDVRVSCSAADAASGLATAADAAFVLVTDVPPGVESASAATDGRIVCDAAGNCATGGPVGGHKVDKKAPVVEIASPERAASFTLNQPVAGRYTCTDAGAGIRTCAGSVAPDSAIDTTVPGARQFTVNATDAAGNSATATVPYSVAYGVRTLYDESKAHKSGSTVPIKIQLIDAAGRNLSSAQVVLHAAGVVRVSDKVSDALAEPSDEAPGTDFKYDAVAGAYHFNLKTTGLASGRYVVVFKAGSDAATYQAPFQVR